MGMRTLSYNLTVEDAKQVYNWFYHAFEEENDPRVTKADIRLKDELEAWLINQGE